MGRKKKIYKDLLIINRKIITDIPDVPEDPTDPIIPRHLWFVNLIKWFKKILKLK